MSPSLPVRGHTQDRTGLGQSGRYGPETSHEFILLDRVHGTAMSEKKYGHFLCWRECLPPVRPIPSFIAAAVIGRIASRQRNSDGPWN